MLHLGHLENEWAFEIQLRPFVRRRSYVCLGPEERADDDIRRLLIRLIASHQRELSVLPACFNSISSPRAAAIHARLDFLSSNKNSLGTA